MESELYGITGVETTNLILFVGMILLVVILDRSLFKRRKSD